MNSKLDQGTLRSGGASWQVGFLRLVDNGSGLVKNQQSNGMGLEIMAHRAQAIGGSLDVRLGPVRGTVVTCTLPRKVLL